MKNASSVSYHLLFVWGFSSAEELKDIIIVSLEAEWWSRSKTVLLLLDCSSCLWFPSLSWFVVVVQSLRLFETPCTAASQASLSLTISQSLLKFMSIESVMPNNHFILCYPLLLLPSLISNCSNLALATKRGSWGLEPSPYKEEMRDTERFPCPGAPQDSSWIQLHNFTNPLAMFESMKYFSKSFPALFVYLFHFSILVKLKRYVILVLTFILQ